MLAIFFFQQMVIAAKVRKKRKSALRFQNLCIFATVLMADSVPPT
jgi:hypothetical protein